MFQREPHAAEGGRSPDRRVGDGVGRIRDPTGGLFERRQDKAVEGVFAGSGDGERKGSRMLSDGRDRVRYAVCAERSYSPTNISESCSGGRISK